MISSCFFVPFMCMLCPCVVNCEPHYRIVLTSHQHACSSPFTFQNPRQLHNCVCVLCVSSSQTRPLHNSRHKRTALQLRLCAATCFAGGHPDKASGHVKQQLCNHNSVRRLALQVVTLPRESPEPALRFFAHIPGLRVLVMGGDGTVGWILKAIMEDLVPAVQQVGGEGCIMLCC